MLSFMIVPMCRKFFDEIFEGLYKLPTGKAVHCRFHVLHVLTRDKRNTEKLPFSTPIFFFLIIVTI